MRSATRKSGIDAVGDVVWGTHLCQFYQTREDLVDVLVSYFKVGLQHNEFCMWVASEPLGVEDAKAALGREVGNLGDYIDKGQIEILDAGEWYTKRGGFERDEVLQGWVAKEKKALERGFDGLRLTGNIFWLEKRDWANFAKYEAEVERVIGNRRMIAICSYSLDKCGASELVDVVNSHRFALIRREDHWQLIESAQRKRAEEALRESEAEFRAIFDGAAIGIGLVDRKGHVIRINAALRHMLGYTIKELRSMAFTEYMHPDDATADMPLFQQMVAGKRNHYQMEKRYIRKDGQMVWGRATVSAVRNPTGKLEFAIGMIEDVTERKRAEEELARYHQHLEELVEERTAELKNANEQLQRENLERKRAEAELRIKDWAIASSLNAIAMTDLEGNMIYVNASFLRMWGYDSSEETIGRPAVEFCQDREKAADVVRTLLRKGIWQGELVALRADGSTFDAHVLASEVEDDEGEPICLMASCVDITERKQAEEALQQKEEYFRALIENSLDVISVVNADGTVRYQSPSYERVLGHKPVDRSDRNALKFVHPDDVPRATEAFCQLVQNPYMTQETEIRVQHGDGSYRTLEVIGENLLNDPVVGGIVANFRDITERKKAEEALRSREEYFRSLIENSLEVIIVVNDDGTIRYQSPSAQRMMGYRPEDRAPENPFRFIHPEDVPKATEAFSQLVQNPGMTRHVELRGKHKDGSWHTLEILAKSLLDDLVVRGIVVNFRDITERVKAEEKLERLYEREKKLRQQLEEEMKKRVEFTRALAHELKTPLTPVVMSSQLLTCELKDETLLKVAQNISRGASNLNSRIDELLDLARGEIGMLQIKPEQVDVLQQLQEVVEDVSSVTSSHGQSLILKLPPSLPLAWCDKVRLRQIVLNLLNNAFKFTPAGGEITLGAKQEDGNLVVEVKDTGPGIAEEEQKRIFNPYHRLESDRERLSGLGLGLALCKTLVELHKGRIWVRSRGGKGSTFGFSLPLEDPESVTNPNGRRSSTNHENTHARCRS